MGHIFSKLFSESTSPGKKPVAKPTKETMNDTTYLEERSSNNQTSLQSKRDFHAEETSTYWLPKDDEEQKRLTGVSILSGYTSISLIRSHVNSNISLSRNYTKGK